jgi:hypothetical protein
MTLIEYPDLIQGSDEWVAARRGIVTASVVGQLITTKTIKPASNEASRALTRHLVAERITGWTEPTWISADMERGNRDEPIARDLYSEHYAEVTELGFMVRDYGEFRIGYSPDGLVGSDGLIEVKSRRQKNQLATVLADSVPLDNMAQLQCGLLVSGRRWCDYVSFSGGMALWRKRVYREPKWLDAIIDAVGRFEDIAAAMIATYTAAVAGLPMTERVLDLEDMVI